MSTAPKMAVSPTTGETTDQTADPVRNTAQCVAPTHEEVAQLAYQYWEARGRPLGSPEQDWFRAEQDVLMERLVWGRHTGSLPTVGRSSQRLSRKPHTS